MGILYMVNDNESVMSKDEVSILKAFADLESNTKRGAINKVIITSIPGGSNSYWGALRDFMVVSEAKKALSVKANKIFDVARNRRIKRS